MCARKTDVSSANSVAISLCVIPGMWKPDSFERLSMQARGSIAMSKSRHERGSPCLTPRYTLKGVLASPFMTTTVVACL